MAKFYIGGLDVRNYTVNVTYLGDDSYYESTNSTTFNVTPANMTAVVVANNVTVKDNTPFIISDVTRDFTGNVTITINGTTYYDGKVKSPIEIAKLMAGNYSANVTFYGDKNYNNRTYTVNFTVSRVDPEITVRINDTTYPNKAVAEIFITNMANGTVFVTVDGHTFDAAVVNGEALVDLTGLSAGMKDAFIEFNSTDRYNNNISTTYRFNVYKNETRIIIDVDVIHVGEDALINVTFNDDATGNVTIYVGDKEFNRTIVDHKVNVTVSGLAYGNYTVVVNYLGDENYTKSSNSTKQIVIKNDINITIGDNTTILVSEDVTVNVELSAKINGTVTVRVNNVNYTVNIADGKGSLPLSGLANDTYTVQAFFAGNEKYMANASNIIAVKVNKVPTKLNVTFVNVTYVGSDVTFTLALNETINATVALRVGDETYNVAIIDGEGVFTVANLANDTYDVNATFFGNDKYE
jgi:hypothetical protein